MVTFHLVSIFPEMFDSYLNESIIKRAQANKKIAIKVYNLRDFADDKRKTVDARPYGGGPGMVFKAEPLIKCLTKITKGKKKVKIIFFAPGGEMLNNKLAQKWAKNYQHIILVAGRYEGIDDRARQIFKAAEVSIGPYVLTGGELPAMVLIDCLARQIKGVLGKSESLEDGRAGGSKLYTRPETLIFKGKKYKVPKILTSGDHLAIENWRQAKTNLKKAV
jgi:tRNA (guanine37-N1)-methyltransferase